MRRHPLGQRPVRRRRDINRPPLAMLLPQVLQQRPVIRQVLHIQRHRRRQMPLERRLPLRNPPRHPQQVHRPLPSHHQHRVQQRIRLHQRPIQINTQRHPRSQHRTLRRHIVPGKNLAHPSGLFSSIHALLQFSSPSLLPQQQRHELDILYLVTIREGYISSSNRTVGKGLPLSRDT